MVSLNNLLAGLNVPKAEPSVVSSVAPSMGLLNAPIDAPAPTDTSTGKADLLSAPVNAIGTAQIYAADLTQMENFEDSIDYMERIDAMPSLEELLESFSKDAEEAELLLNDSQRDLLKLVSTQLSTISDTIDLKQIDVTITAIMERLQENPEVISALRPQDMRALINSFDRLYAVKSSVSAARKAKASTKTSNKAKQLAFLESLENELEF